MDVLPLELWCNVFAFLDTASLLRATLVSHKWRGVVWQGATHYKINTAFFARLRGGASKQKEALSNVLRFLSTNCPRLRSLDLSNTNIVLTPALVAAFPPGLRHLNLQRCTQLYDESLCCLPSSLCSLTLDLNAQLTNKALNHLPKGLKQLRLSHCWQLNDRSFLEVHDSSEAEGSGMPSRLLWDQLELLDLSSCWKLSDAALQKLSSFTTLKTLDLNNCSFSDQGLAYLPPSLRVLILERCDQMRGTGFHLLGEGLEELNISFCSRIVVEAFAGLPKRLLKLEMAGMVYLKDEHMEVLPRSLQSLNIAECVHITDEGLLRLPPTLVRLTLSKTKVTAQGLHLCALHLRKLREVNIQGCKLFKEDHLNELRRHFGKRIRFAC
ncbi:hypothetical protein QOT17_023989 [Balamuthia mandrillaris]